MTMTSANDCTQQTLHDIMVSDTYFDAKVDSLRDTQILTVHICCCRGRLF
jgi:hypothetical protein